MRYVSLLGVHEKRKLLSSRAIYLCELAGAVALVALCFNFKSLFKSVYFYTFMRRDIDRALELLQGKLIFFGPEASGGGHLPGPLVYILLAIPLAFYPFWQSCFFLLLNMLTAMAVAGWAWIRRNFGTVAAVCFVLTLSLSYPSRSFVLLFLNVSYMLPFALTGILAAMEAFSRESEEGRTRAFLLSCLMIGLGLQLHFSIMCLLLALIFMQVFSRQLKLERVPWRGFAYGFGVIALCLAPFAVWKLAVYFGHPFGQAGSYVGKAPGSLQTLLMLAEYSSDVPWETTTQEVALRIFAMTPLLLIVGMAAAVTNAIYEKIKGITPEETATPTEKKSWRVLLWIMAWGFFPFAYVFVVHMGRRYGMVYCLSLIVAAVLLQARLLKKARTTILFNVFAIATLFFLKWLYFEINEKAAINWLAKQRHVAILILPVILCAYYIRHYYRHAYAVALAVFLTATISLVQRDIVAPRGLREKTVPRFHNEDWVKIWRTIYRETGWTYEHAIRRIYFVNLRLDEDPMPGYEQVARNHSGAKIDREIPHGYFVLNTKYLKKKGDRGAYREFLETQRIPQVIKDSLKNGDLELGEPMYEGTMVIPYFVRNQEKLPAYFHNLGQGYVRTERDKILDKVEEREGTKTLPEGYLFKWNECPDLNPFCSTGALVRAEPTKQGHKISVNVIGSAISQNSPWISPSWTQAWIEPYVEIRCGKSVEKLVLFSSIGMMRQFGSNEFNELLQANNSIVAPFEREFNSRCKKIDDISVGRASSKVEKLVDTMELPQRRLTVRLENP